VIGTYRVMVEKIVLDVIGKEIVEDLDEPDSMKALEQLEGIDSVDKAINSKAPKIPSTRKR